MGKRWKWKGEGGNVKQGRGEWDFARRYRVRKGVEMAAGVGKSQRWSCGNDGKNWGRSAGVEGIYNGRKIK